MKRFLISVLFACIGLAASAQTFQRFAASRLVAIADTTPPTLVSATIPSAGNVINLVFNEAVNVSGAVPTISMSGGASTLSSPTGAGTTTLVYSLSRTVNSGETGTISYTQPGNGIEDAAGNDFASVSTVTVTNGSTQSGLTYLLNEDFETTGAPSGWTSVGSPNWDYTATALQGSESLNLLYDATRQAISPTFTAQPEIRIRMRIRSQGTPVAWFSYLALCNGSTPLAYIGITSSNHCAIGWPGDGYNNDIMSPNTTYYVWVHYIKGTGANGVLSASFNTVNSEPTIVGSSGVGYIASTIGNFTLNVDNLKFENLDDPGNSGIIIDEIRVTSGAIIP